MRRLLTYFWAVTLCLPLLLENCFAVIVADIDWGEPPSSRNGQVLFSIPRHALMPHQETVPRGVMPNNYTVMPTRSTHAGDIYFQKHIRVMFFDTNLQRLVDSEGNFPGKIYYFSIRSQETMSRTFSVSDWFTLHYDVATQQVRIDLTSFNPLGFFSKIIRCNSSFKQIIPETSLIERPFINIDTFGHIERSEEIYTKKIVGHVLQKDPYPIVSADLTKLMTFFNEAQVRRKTTNKEISWIYRLYDPIDNLECFWGGSFNSTDSGSIGELAADITMQWLGFNKKDAKYKGKSNNGFDGVYYNSGTLILSEAKLWQVAPSLESILHEELYAKISRRLKKLAQYGKMVVADYIKSFIETYPAQVYLQPYICLSDGQVKSALSPLLQVANEVSPFKSGLKTPAGETMLTPTFNNTIGLSPTSSQEVKVSALVDYMRTIGVTSLLEASEITMKAFNKLKEEEMVPVTPVSKTAQSKRRIGYEPEAPLLPITMGSPLPKFSIDTTSMVSQTPPQPSGLIPLPSAPQVSQSLGFNEENFLTLLRNLQNTGKLSEMTITEMAGYSGDNAKRNYNKMTDLSLAKKREKWNQLVQAILAKGMSLQDLLKKAA